MPLYVIAKQTDQDVLDTVIFHAGESGEQEAVAVFTSEAAAQAYLAEAEWTEPHQPVALPPLALLQWVQQAFGQGVRYLTVDPRRSSQVAGQPQPVLSIEEQLAHCGDILAAGLAGGGD